MIFTPDVKPKISLHTVRYHGSEHLTEIKRGAYAGLLPTCSCYRRPPRLHALTKARQRHKNETREAPTTLNAVALSEEPHSVPFSLSIGGGKQLATYGDQSEKYMLPYPTRTTFSLKVAKRCNSDTHAKQASIRSPLGYPVKHLPDPPPMPFPFFASKQSSCTEV